MLSTRETDLSYGQAQLLQLARALLRGNKIIVLDEATANLDSETDAAIQTLIRTAFQDITIITITHRIATISDYDEVLVLDQGLVAERGKPRALLDDPNTLFSHLAVTQSDGPSC